VDDERAAHWDQRYAAGDQLWTVGPHPLVVEVVSSLRPGRALDVGAGEGRHAVWLASRGWRVTALDFSAVGVERGREHAQREGVSVDFVVGDVADWEPVSGAFDLVLVSYLHLEEEAMERVRGWVAPGGRLVVVGHAAGGAAGPRNPRFRHTVASMRNRAGDLDVRRCEEVVDGAAERADIVLVAARHHGDVTEVELVGGVEQRDLFLVAPDDSWPAEYRRHEARIRRALGEAAVAVEHIGSTSVPGLAAKPIIDILVTVPDIAAEQDHVEPLLAAGYVLRVREPGHRLVRTSERDVHVHLLQVGDQAAEDYLLFRDHLRADASDRALYEDTKRELTSRQWPDMNAYADAKTDVIEAIKARAREQVR